MCFGGLHGKIRRSKLTQWATTWTNRTTTACRITVYNHLHRRRCWAAQVKRVSASSVSGIPLLSLRGMCDDVTMMIGQWPVKLLHLRNSNSTTQSWPCSTKRVDLIIWDCKRRKPPIFEFTPGNHVRLTIMYTLFQQCLRIPAFNYNILQQDNEPRTNVAQPKG